ncbi:MAG TPA: amidohydrolase [Acetobacteraceae bacterium]|jgi:amidohydrolase|nr:amidohydrolase [Acetobacteraceae bacterium]
MDRTLVETLTAWRRHLHAHPELTLHEKHTAAFVCERLQELGIPFVAGVGGHGVVATLSRGQSNRSVGLRADMDALPIAETSGAPHASTNHGVMHACGHDGHTTSLLGAAALLARDPSWTGTVQLVFQPAEEGGGGARAMIADGLFDRFPMERIFGYHNWPGLDAGTVAVHDGPVMAAGARLEFHIKGHSGHAALPHLARDPMVAAAHLLLALQTIVSRNVDPLNAVVITIATMQAGSAPNQIPGEAVMRGTMRTLSATVSDQVDAAIRRVAAGIAQACDVEIEVTARHGNLVTQNSPQERDLAAEAVTAAGLPLRRDLLPAMTGEDFCWYLQERPGAFVWIGNGPAAGGRELHNSNYDFNDAILPAAAGYFASAAKRALAP